MGKRKRKRDRIAKKIEIEANKPPRNPAIVSPSSGDLQADPAASTHQNWADLPESLLVSIISRLSSATEYLAFAGACHPWRSAASSTVPPGPPLLLAPATVRSRRCSLAWAGPPRCSIETLNRAKSHQSPISSRTLRRFCIGCSYAELIFTDGGRSVVLADAFTGREVSSPDLPAGSFRLCLGILTAPLSSPSCSVLVVALNSVSDVYSIFCWRLGSGQWSELDLTKSPEILSLVVFKGQVFGLDPLCRLIVVEFKPQMSWRLLEAQLPNNGQFLYSCYGRFGQNLFECEGELHLVVFAPMGEFPMLGWPRIYVYKLDMSKSVWVKKDSLGNWCLFIDAVSRRAFACHDPTTWGGRKNCVYLAGPGLPGWSVFPLDGDAIDMSEKSLPLHPSSMMLPKWPSPIWVYPSMLSLDLHSDV